MVLFVFGLYLGSRFGLYLGSIWALFGLYVGSRLGSASWGRRASPVSSGDNGFPMEMGIDLEGAG